MHDKVIACVDESPYADAVCDYASWAAKRLGAPISVLHSDAHSGSEATEHTRQQSVQDAQQRLESQGFQADVIPHEGELETAVAALETDIRLLVMGKRGSASASEHGHTGKHLEKTIRAVHRPVLVTTQQFTAPSAVMIAFDGGVSACKAVDLIARSPLLQGLPIHVVTVDADVDGTRTPLAQARDQLCEAGFDTYSTILAGEPEDVLDSYRLTHNIDLMVMGAFGQSPLRHSLLGSTTSAVLRNTHISTLVFR